MRKELPFWVASLLGIGACACGPRQEAQQPASVSTPPEDVPEVQAQTPPSKTEPSKERDADVEDRPPPAPPAATDQPKQQGSGLKEICEKINQRANQKCTKQVADMYRSSCGHYLHQPGSCDQEIQKAMECQYGAADDAFCAHQADANCSQVNRELKTCQRGTAPADQNTAEDLTLPSNWEPVRDSKLGFTVAMPPGAEIDAKSKRRTWQTQEGGVSYYVAEIDYPSTNLNNATYVRTVVGYVGYRCQQHLKLHGELELKGVKVVQYHSRCQDGTEWHGMLHFWNGKAVSTALHTPAGTAGVQEPFFYSFAVGNSSTGQ